MPFYSDMLQSLKKRGESSTSSGKTKELQEKSEMPWAIYVDESFRPVVEWTMWGPLLVGDDGTIFISCMNGKAYAIEAIPNLNGTGEAEYAAEIAELVGCAPGTGPPSYHPPLDGGQEFAAWPQPLVMLNFAVVSAKARSQWGYPPDDKLFGHALVETNVGYERFDAILPDLDLESWNAPPVTLEQMEYVSNKIGLKKGQKKHVSYRAREINLGRRPTEREETRSTYCAQMTLPLNNQMKIGSGTLKAMYPVIWGASAGYVSFPSFGSVDMAAENGSPPSPQWVKAKQTAEHAKENEEKGRSECQWEFDAWRDIFATIRDDPLLSMDKHKVDFLENKHLGSITNEEEELDLGTHPVLSTCTPDCTFGLAADDANESDYGSDDEDKHPILTPKKSLNAKCLWDLYLHSKTGLTSDPKMLSFGLTFPWAVYEAKKALAGNVEMQIERASEIYLRILHDLALVPGKAEEPRPFQSEQSSHFKMFSWTSEGPIWKMFVCYHQRQSNHAPLWLPKPGEIPQYNMKMIWEGNITSRSHAWELQYLVDWVYKWATNEFRSLVCSQLKKWHTHVLDLYVNSDMASQDYSSQITISQKQQGDIYKRFQARRRTIAASKDPDNLIILDEIIPQPDSEWIPPWWARLAKQPDKRAQLIKELGLEQGNSRSGKRKLSGNSPRAPRKKRQRLADEAVERQAKQEAEIVITSC